jgi:hypothetical protein
MKLEVERWYSGCERSSVHGRWQALIQGLRVQLDLLLRPSTCMDWVPEGSFI